MMSTEDRWALNRQCEAEHKARVAASDAWWEDLLDKVQCYGNKLNDDLNQRFDSWDKLVAEESAAQQKRVSALDMEDEGPPIRTGHTPAEIRDAFTNFMRRFFVRLRNYFDLSYRYMTQEEAVEKLRLYNLNARLGGETDNSIVLGSLYILKDRHGQDYYEDRFTIEEVGEIWVVHRRGREMFARNLDEAVKMVILSYAQEGERYGSSSTYADARESS